MRAVLGHNSRYEVFYEIHISIVLIELFMLQLRYCYLSASIQLNWAAGASMNVDMIIFTKKRIVRCAV